MSVWQTRFGNSLLNAALLVGALSVTVLLYALASRTVFPGPDPERPASDSSALVGSIIQVEVRNGAGVADLASQTTQYLRDRGFDVVDQGNYSTFDQQKSIVIDRIGNMEAAREVAEAMGIPRSRVEQKIRPEYYLDASVIIGHDYEQLRPFRDGP